MTDMLTTRIHDAFINAGGSPDEWAEWLETHGFRHLADIPTPPRGFAYQPADGRKPDDDTLDHLAALHDGVLDLQATASVIRDMDKPEGDTDARLGHVEADLRNAAKTLERLLTFNGYRQPAEQ